MPPPPGGKPVTYFVIVGPQDAAIFEHCLPPRDDMHLKRQFMAHSALDLVEEMMWTSGDLYLSKVDKFEDTFYLSAYVGVGPLRLLLLQDQEPHSNVKVFFTEMMELCVKYLTNPFSDPSKPVASKAFRDRALQIFQQYF